MYPYSQTIKSIFLIKNNILDRKLFLIFPLLAIALITQYFLWSELTDESGSEIIESFELGYDRGIKDTVNTIINKTKNCNPTTLFSYNYSITLIDVKCVP